MADETSDWLTVPEVAKLLHSSEATVRRYVRRGLIDAYYVAGKYLFRPEAVTKVLNESKVA